MTGATPTGTNSFGYNEEYSCVQVAGGKGWSGAGYAPAAATDMSMIDDSYWLHFSMKTTNEISKSAPYAIVIGENAHFTMALLLSKMEIRNMQFLAISIATANGTASIFQ